MIKILSTLLLFNGTTPDYSGVPSYALPALQQAFADGNYEIIPDPEPIVKSPEPNWDEFNLVFSTLPSLLQAEMVANSNHPSIVGKKDLAYLMIDTHGTKTFSSIFPLFCQAGQVSTEIRIEWAELAQTFNMPADFVSIIRG